MFIDRIPDKVLEFPSTRHFVEVLDLLNEFKQEAMSEGFRIYNPALCLKKSWLVSILEEYGVKDFPVDIPLTAALQFLLNINTVWSLRGCKRGIQFYCSVLSLGEVSIDDTDFFKDSPSLRLNSARDGTIVKDSLDRANYLVGDSSTAFDLSYLTVTISSKYFNGDFPVEEMAIKNYIESTLPLYLGFSPHKQITYNYQSREELFFDPLLNNYFI